jgi:Fe-S cluster assembly protein SufD
MAPWLDERRREAAERNLTLPVPTIREEAWRYTNLRGIDFSAFRTPERPGAVAAAERPAPGTLLVDGEAAGRLVQRDGTVVHAELRPEVAAQGVLFMSLERAAEEHPELVERHLGSIVGTGEKFAAENAALWSGGMLLYVPRNVAVALPLHATFELATPGGAQHWRTLIVVDEGASATLIEEHAEGVPATRTAWPSCGSATRRTSSTSSSRTAAPRRSTSRRTAPRSAATPSSTGWRAAWAAGSARPAWSRGLVGQGSTVKLTGSYVLSEGQHLDTDTTQEHDAPHATSDLAFKGVLAGRSRTVWRGVIRVAEGAQKTDAYQENRNLLLSHEAHADSIPGLEIKANDVRCTHGATGRPGRPAAPLLPDEPRPAPQRGGADHRPRLLRRGARADQGARVRAAIGEALDRRLP